MAKVLDLEEARRKLHAANLGPQAPKPGRDYGPRHVPGQMNQTEKKYAVILFVRKLAGEILDYRFESVKLRLADERCWITLDFAVWYPDGIVELVDAKGPPPQEKTIIKMKVAADRYRGLYRIVLERLIKGEWHRREF